MNLHPGGSSCQQRTSRQGRRKKLNGRANRRSRVARPCFGRFAALRLGLLTIGVAGVLFVLATTAYALSFGDVGASQPYETAISDLASRGLINGFAGGTFRLTHPSSVSSRQDDREDPRSARLGYRHRSLHRRSPPTSIPPTSSIRTSMWRSATRRASPTQRPLPRSRPSTTCHGPTHHFCDSGR